MAALSLPAHAKSPSKGQREAIIAGVTVTTLALTMNPFVTALTVIGLDKGMDSDLNPAKRSKRHTKSGR